MHAELEILAGEGKVDNYFEVNYKFHTMVQNYAHNRWLSPYHC